MYLWIFLYPLNDDTNCDKVFSICVAGRSHCRPSYGSTERFQTGDKTRRQRIDYLTCVNYCHITCLEHHFVLINSIWCLTEGMMEYKWNTCTTYARAMKRGVVWIVIYIIPIYIWFWCVLPLEIHVPVEFSSWYFSYSTVHKQSNLSTHVHTSVILYNAAELKGS